MKKDFLVLFLIYLNYSTAHCQMEVMYDGAYSYFYEDRTSGKQIRANYMKAFPFRGPEALVLEGETYQLIDTTGKVLRSFPYDNMAPSEEENVYTFHSDSTVGFISSNGKIIKEIAFDESYRWQEDNRGYVIKKDGKIGIFTAQRGLVLPMEYETDNFMVTFNYDGNLYFEEDDYFCLKHGENWGVININGGIKVPFEYEKLVQMYSDNIGAKKNGKWGLLDQNTGKPLINFEYDAFLGRYTSTQMVTKPDEPYIFLKDGKIVFYDISKNKVVPNAPYGEERYVDSWLILTHNGKQGVVEANGNIKVDFVYDRITEVVNRDPSEKRPLYKVQKGEMTGLLIPEIGFIFDMIECGNVNNEMVNSKKYFVVNKNKKEALFNDQQKPITGFDYDYIGTDENGFVVSLEGRRGTLSVTGVVTWKD